MNEEFLRDGMQSLSGPGREPVDCTAVHESSNRDSSEIALSNPVKCTGEFSTSVSEPIADRAEREANMQILSTKLHKMVVNVVPRVDLSSLFTKRADLTNEITIDEGLNSISDNDITFFM